MKMYTLHGNEIDVISESEMLSMPIADVYDYFRDLKVKTDGPDVSANSKYREISVDLFTVNPKQHSDYFDSFVRYTFEYWCEKKYLSPDIITFDQAKDGILKTHVKLSKTCHVDGKDGLFDTVILRQDYDGFPLNLYSNF